MTADDSQYVEMVRVLCRAADLPVGEDELPALAASYRLIAEGIEGLTSLEGYAESPLYTVIAPAAAAGGPA